ncbi:MAG: hypothetical protein MUC48_04310 [Leptolyngbya sp. Prado105]|nr:hypothetical protein [Leptolyngbya sp. Prado105]
MKIAFWLVPSESEQSIYQPIINELAHHYNTAIFTPHVTLHSCECEKLSAFESVVDIILETDQILYSESFTRSLFIQFFSNPNLDRLSASFQQNFESPFVLDPHLSLIYAHLPESEKRSLIPEIPLNKTIHFNQIRAIQIPNRIQTRKDIEAFREI